MSFFRSSNLFFCFSQSISHPIPSHCLNNATKTQAQAIMNLDLTRELEPAPVNESLNFKFASPLPPWEDYDEDSKEEFDNALNCYGVVYLRLLRAQRLPCPVGSSVCAVVSLPPWKGRVRTHRTSAFLSSLDHGVCVQWNEEGGFCSMVHAWHSEESPIPKIKVDLMFSPLGMGLFDFTMCSLELNVQVLMKQPGIWKENVWCPTSCTSSFHNSSTSLGGGPTKETDRIPMIQLDAMFAPSNDGRIATGQLKLPSTTTTTTTTTASTADPTKAKLSPQPSPPPPPPPPPQEDKELDLEQEALDESFASIDTTTTENNQQEPQPHTENSIALPTPTRATTTTIATTITTTTTTTTSPPPPTPLKHQPNPHQPHLLRIVNLWMPHSCAVCQKILVGRNAGFHCEECGIQCCSDCRLHIDIQIPCGSETAKKKTAPKLNMNSLLSIVAPDEAYLYHNSTTANNKDEDDTTMVNRAKDHVEAPQPGKIGIGSLQLDIVKVGSSV